LGLALVRELLACGSAVTVLDKNPVSDKLAVDPQEALFLRSQTHIVDVSDLEAVCCCIDIGQALHLASFLWVCVMHVMSKMTA
jgi:UDP-glucose 4-epimerase